MNAPEPEDRHSEALQAELITDPRELAKHEARNGLRQFDAVIEMIEGFLDPERPFKLRLSHILQLHRIALDGISSYARNFRPSTIKISGSQHQPLGAHLVPEKIEELCDYINDNWKSASPVHLGAYALWRLNWIHPFTDGNGRTSRAASRVAHTTRFSLCGDCEASLVSFEVRSASTAPLKPKPGLTGPPVPGWRGLKPRISVV